MLVRAEPPKINDLYGELALRSAVSPTAAVDAGKTALPDLLFEQVAVVKASDSPVGVDRVIAGTDRSFTYHCLLLVLGRGERLVQHTHTHHCIRG